MNQETITVKQLKIIGMFVFFSIVYLIPHNSYAEIQSVDEYWSVHPMIGKFPDSIPPYSHIFIFKYGITNGTIESIIGNHLSSTLSVKTSGIENSNFELKFPRNYPYTNTPYDTTSDFIVLLNDKEVKYELRENDCYFTFSIPFSGNTEIKIIWTYLLSSPYPIRGDNVPDHCIMLTINDNMSPLQQFRAGILAYEVKCIDDLSLIIKSNDGSPACVTQETKIKLIGSSWAKPV